MPTCVSEHGEKHWKEIHENVPITFGDAIISDLHFLISIYFLHCL